MAVPLSGEPAAGQENTVVAIDPGRTKCGVAVVRRAADAESPHTVLYQGVIDVADMGSVLDEVGARFVPDLVIVGNGTTSAEMVRLAKSRLAADVTLVNEEFSTLAARKRYFRDHPPRGLRRLIPVSLQTPDRPYDDYAAVVLAETHLSR